jgi:hypothetical protein
MAIINKTGITNGGTIQAEHITRAIDALSGVSTDTIVATGSFSGSLVGIATSASFATTASFAANATSFPFTGSARITGSLAVTGSTTLNGSLGGSITGSSTMIMNLSTLGSSGNFILPTTEPSTPTRGSVYWDFANNYLYIYNGSAWVRALFAVGG